jgi:predicted nucleic acid-binding protein
VILVDAGTIVALLDRHDRHHRRCASAHAAVQEGLATTWPAVGEALARLNGVPGGPEAVWQFVERSQCRLLALEPEDLRKLKALTAKSHGLSFSLASLVCVAERHGIDAVLTVDNRLANCRSGRRKVFRR